MDVKGVPSLFWDIKNQGHYRGTLTWAVRVRAWALVSPIHWAWLPNIIKSMKQASTSQKQRKEISSVWPHWDKNPKSVVGILAWGLISARRSVQKEAALVRSGLHPPLTHCLSSSSNPLPGTRPQPFPLPRIRFLGKFQLLGYHCLNRLITKVGGHTTISL